MGKTEVIIFICIALFVGFFFYLYLQNSKKINAEKESKDAKPEEKKSEPPKVEKLKEDEKLQKQQKELEKSQEEAKKELKAVMDAVSIQSENYIKSLEEKDEQNAKKSKFEMKEVSKYEVDRDEAKEEAAIILGVKKQHVHIFDNCDECEHNTHETTSSILSGMEYEDEELEISNSAYNQVSLDSFEEDESVAEEFSNLSKRMKVLIMTDALKKKSDNENQE